MSQYQTGASKPVSQWGNFVQYVSPNEAALTYSCSRQHIARLYKSGRLPYIKLGKRSIRIKVSDLEAFFRPINGKGRVQ